VELAVEAARKDSSLRRSFQALVEAAVRINVRR
jgi:hypothetical protein